MVKAIARNILWTSCRHEGALIHYVTVYIPPNDTKEAKEYLRTLRWILFRISERDKKACIVVAGDFNKIAMEGVDFIEKDFGLTRIVASNIETHNLGNNLDGIWTNMKNSSCILHDGLVDITDHSMIEVSLLVDESVSR